MPRIRTVKPEFFRSPSTASVDFPVRIFFQAMWCWADDFGIGETNLNGLLGFAFPDEDGFTAQDLRTFCADVAQHFDVNFYTVRGRHYYAIPSWENHQKLEKRATRRKHPTPDDPDAVPDQRIYACAESAPDDRRRIGAESGEMLIGTGEVGTGERELKTSTTAAPPKIPYTVEFQRWWSTYPRRDTGKADAAKAYDKARKIVDAETLLVAAQRYAQDPNLPDIQFIPHGAKWLNGKRWEDGPCPLRTDRRPTGGERAQRILEQGRALAAETQQMELR